MTNLILPSYLEQSEPVKDRFTRLKQRPVTLEVKGLQKEFDSVQGRVTALNNINFKTHKREFVTVIGPSGCGKSTLIRILAGLETKTAGQVLLDGKEVSGPGDRSEKIRTYNFPQGRVTEHRIGLSLYRLEAVLQGNLDMILDPLITHFQAEALKAA